MALTHTVSSVDVPDVQLALVGSMALDDPEGWRIYASITEQVRSDPGIHVFTNLIGVGNVEVNAFQRLSDVIIQKSLREGFGLVVSEALWKGTPVVAERAGGIPLQMADGTGGILVDTVEECANATLSLLNDRERAKSLGRKGHEQVKQQFLIPRLVLNELDLLGSLEVSWAPAPPAQRFASRDPVCGMALDLELIHPERVVAGTVFHFCSDQCQRQFSRQPYHYLGAGSGGSE